MKSISVSAPLAVLSHTVHTKDLYEVAQVISGCDLFVGNQSAAFWIAEVEK